MAMNKISDDELNLVNGGTNVGMGNDDKLEDIKCPKCGGTVKGKSFLGGRMTCVNGHTFNEADLNLKTKDYSGGSLSGDVIA